MSEQAHGDDDDGDKKCSGAYFHVKPSVSLTLSLHQGQSMACPYHKRLGVRTP